MPFGWPKGQSPSQRPPKRTLFVALLLFLSALILSTEIVVEITENNRFHQTQKASVLEKLATIRAKLEGALNSELQISQSLITTIHLQKGMDSLTFSRAGALIFREAKYLRNVAVAKGTVIEHIYPLRGNERAVGMDYTKNPAQWPAVERAIKSRALVVAGPVNLVQGGVGIIGRLPIYLPRGAQETDEDTFYGLLSIVMDVPKLLGAAGISENDPELSIAIRGKDGLGEKGDVFFGDPSLFTKEAVSTEVQFSNNTWVLAAALRQGWDTTSPWIVFYRIASSLSWLVVMALLALQFREMKLRWEADQKLRRSEERYRTLVETTGTGFVIIDFQGRVVAANNEYVRLTGHRELSEILGRSVLDWTAPQEKQKNAEAIARCLRDRGIRNLEVDYVWPSGRVQSVEINAAVQGEGAALQIVTLCRDIKERKRIEDELLLFKESVENASDAVGMATPEGRHYYQNKSFDELFGDIGENPPESTYVDPGVGHEVFQTIMAGGKWTGEVRMYAKDRRILTVFLRAYSSKDASGRITGLVGVHTDITEQKKSEENLRASEERLRSLYEGMTEGVALHEYVLGEDGQPVNYRIVDVNPRFCAILELQRESVVGKLATEAYGTPEAPYLQVYSGPFLTGKGSYLETYYPPMEKYFEISIAPWGKNGFATIFLDVTEQKRAEAERQKLQEQLLQAQKMESVGRLAGGVAHDFNNMLAVILGYTELAMNSLGPGDALSADLIAIRKAATKSADLTRQLLAFARKQTVSPKVIDLNDAVEHALAMLKRLIGEDIDLRWLPGKEVSPVNIDPTQVDQILTNLCINARDAIGKHGRITIETGTATFDAEFCAHNADYVQGTHVVLTLSDNGQGMDRETLGLIFEPFYTTKAIGKGTGLGLATVYGIVKQNNGFITVDSELGSGTTFKIYLPVHFAKPQLKAEETLPKVEPHGGGTILLVEDESTIMLMTKLMLERMGYAVISTNRPFEALLLAKEHSGRLDLLMTDVVMPEMNGRELSEKIQTLRPDIRILFMSGYTADVIEHQGVLDPAVNFLQKPFTMKDLSAKLREALEKP